MKIIRVAIDFDYEVSDEVQAALEEGDEQAFEDLTHELVMKLNTKKLEIVEID